VSFATVTREGPLRAVLAGAGALGPYWARELIESPDCELAGWVDLDMARVTAEATRLGVPDVPAGTDLEEMLDGRRPNFLLNVTPPDAHHGVTLAGLERGLPVLSEKPMAATLAQALDMVAAADRAGQLLMVSQNRRYMPELVAFRDTVTGLGRLSDLSCEFYVAHRGKAATFLYALEQPLLLDMAIHLFDGARAITGAEPVSVYCDSHNPPWSWYAGPAAASAIFRMSDGLRFTFTGNWAADGFRTSWTGAWRATGERGSATWDGKRVPRVEPAPGARLEVAVPVVSEPDETRFQGLEASLADFVHALQTGSAPAGECHDNLSSLAMCHAAVESAERGMPVAVDAYAVA